MTRAERHAARAAKGWRLVGWSVYHGRCKEHVGGPGCDAAIIRRWYPGKRIVSVWRRPRPKTKTLGEIGYEAANPAGPSWRWASPELRGTYHAVGILVAEEFARRAKARFYGGEHSGETMRESVERALAEARKEAGL